MALESDIKVLAGTLENSMIVAVMPWCRRSDRALVHEFAYDELDWLVLSPHHLYCRWLVLDVDRLAYPDPRRL